MNIKNIFNKNSKFITSTEMNQLRIKGFLNTQRRNKGVETIEWKPLIRLINQKITLVTELHPEFSSVVYVLEIDKQSTQMKYISIDELDHPYMKRF